MELRIKNNQFVLEDIFNNIILETRAKGQLSICMRDDTIEMSVPGSEKFYRVDIETGEIYEI